MQRASSYPPPKYPFDVSCCGVSISKYIFAFETERKRKYFLPESSGFIFLVYIYIFIVIYIYGLTFEHIKICIT